MTVELPKLNEWQKAVLDKYISHSKDNIITVLSKRQCGKSICLEVLLLYVSLNSKGKVSICVSPTINQSRKIFQDIIKMLNGTPLLSRKNESLLSIDFINGSQILFKSAEQRDSLRGYTVSGVLCIDEAAFISDETFYELLLPWCNVNKSSIIITSTPKFKQGFFYDNYIRGLNEEEGNISIDWGKYDTSKYLSNEKLELYRQQLPKQAFISEFLGQFCDADSLVFGDFKSCIKDSEINMSKPLYMSIDWGSGSGKDNTALTFLQYDETNDIIIVPKIEAFNDLNTQDTIDKIISHVKKYPNLVEILVEKNSIGKIYYDCLFDAIDDFLYENDERDVIVNKFVTTNDSKAKIINHLALLIEQNKIILPNDKKLHTELSFYEAKVNSQNKVIYNAQSGYKDDRVMSLAIGVELIEKYK